MELTTIEMYFLGGFFVLAILFLIRFPGEAGVKISLFDKLKLQLWGKKGSSEDHAPGNQNVSFKESEIAGDVIAGDKHVSIVHQQGDTSDPSTQPKLSLSFYDRDNTFNDEISSIHRPNVVTGDIAYRIGIKNHSPESVAKGILVRLEFYWRGDLPSKPPGFRRLTSPPGWRIEAPKLRMDQAAIISYRGTEDLIAKNQPLILAAPRVEFEEKLIGHFLVKYFIYSHEPQSEAQGDLKIQLEYRD